MSSTLVNTIACGITYMSPTEFETYLSSPNPFKSEKDPNGKSPKEAGAKLDAGKSPIYRGLLDYFPRACLSVAAVSEAGAKKYAWKGWESVPDGINRYSDALGRHIVNESIEGPLDPDGFLHKACVAWNSLAALELYLRDKESNAV